MDKIVQRIAEELGVLPPQVQAAATLLDEGATVPFIARYRKEVTSGLDDTQLRKLEERLRYLRELVERREVILNSIREQDKLTTELEAQILAAETKTVLEDLYLPYKPKRRTKAQIAREAGLAPLAETLLNDPSQTPEILAADFVDTEKGIADVKQALDGARQILMEQFSEQAALLGQLRNYLWEQGILTAKLADESKAEAGAKFSDYFDYQEAIQKIPSHRALALFRGRNEKILRVTLSLPHELAEDGTEQADPCEGMIMVHNHITQQNRPADNWLLETVRWAWRFKIRLNLEVELLMHLREQSENEAIDVFARNIRDLLLAAPAGLKATMGLDPGLRTGVKVAVVDQTGKLMDTATIYPHAPKKQWDQAIAVLAALAQTHKVKLVSIGNGTASRETDKLVAELIKNHPELKLQKLVVSEAGASVYSASEFAAQEFPELDVSLRGAVSIARRLQDPLAELVKIEPKAIGVGQYQHDVNQSNLARSLGTVVEDCVNAVGVDVNSASVPLLSRVSGLNAGLARNIVAWRDEHGVFTNRDSLKQVPRLGEKAFEQAAGFLRIRGGDNPLDMSAVHPEAYPVVERILRACGKPIEAVLGDSQFLSSVQPIKFTDDRFGVPTVTDIIAELEKPGRDPRPEFKTAIFDDKVQDMNDLRPDMLLEGVVTNVTNFGAFVDIGVHQDGLVHISMLADRFVKDPHEVVKAGDVVKVKVLEIDLKRKRIALSMRLTDSSHDQASASPQKNHTDRPQAARSKPSARRRESTPQQQPASAFGSALAEALAASRKR